MNWKTSNELYPSTRPKRGEFSTLPRVYKPHDLIAYTDHNHEEVMPKFAVIRQIESQTELRDGKEFSMPTKLDAWPAAMDFVNDPVTDPRVFRATVTVNPNTVIGATTPDCAMHAMALHALVVKNVHTIENNRIKMRREFRGSPDAPFPAHLEETLFAKRYARELVAVINSKGATLTLTAEDENAARLLAHAMSHSGLYEGMDYERQATRKILADLLT